MPTNEAADVTLDALQAIILQGGYDVEPTDDRLRIRDPESRIVLNCVLEESVVYFSVACLTLPHSKLTPVDLQAMLLADNGVSTSFFQLYCPAGDQWTITLNNFCKLQTLGADDTDDILSCIEFLLADLLPARELLHHLAD